MRHIPITCEQRAAMLRAVGVEAVEQLFADVPDEVLLGRPLDLPGPMSEIELVGHLRELSARDVPATSLVSFMGAGCYDHHVPAIVDHVLRRPEFFTAYTPYQPEVSQGTLQAMFEFQTMICELTGMDVANASMYDGATALTEAALMAARVTKRRRVVLSGAIHPQWRETVETYAKAGVIETVVLEAEEGRTLCDKALLGELLADAAALIVASPGYYGELEDLRALGEAAADAGALFVVASNPILLGVLEPPAAYGADIVVGEGQPLGGSLSYGGPGLGFFACRREYVRQMPGRVVGKTIDVDGNDGYVLTLSTREQHIRREKATSNICSNHALNALGAAVYLSAVGMTGLAGIARACVAKAHYLHASLLDTGRFSAPWEGSFGYEFALRFDGDVQAMRSTLLERGYLAGVDVSDESGIENLVLFAVTEKRTRAEIDAFVAEVVSL